MRHYRSMGDKTFYSSSDSDKELPNHRFLNEAKTLVAKLNAVSGVREIHSCPIEKSSARVPLVANVYYAQGDCVMVRYFAKGIFQDIKVECEPSAIDKLKAVVDKYVVDFRSANNKRKMQRAIQDRELEDYHGRY
jgi:hypothetical protein